MRPFEHSVAEWRKAAPIVVGYLGAMVPHKGWPVFVNMVNRSAGDNGIKFVVFSDRAANVGEDASHKVHVTTDTPDAMTRAVQEADVDVVVHWASWAETFSFTTIKAMAGGAWVLTNPVSGNVQAAVRASGHGAVLEDEAALIDFFNGGGLTALVAERRAHAPSQALINGKLLRFYHFTKLGPIGDVMTRRYARGNSEIFELWWWYRHEVERFTDTAIPKGWWHYGTFDNGDPIEKRMRELYRTRRDLQATFPDPRRTGKGTLHEWLEVTKGQG